MGTISGFIRGLILICGLAAVEAQAQQFAGAEIAGQGINVAVNGVTNTVYFDKGGAARITAADGTQVSGDWFVRDESICVAVADAEECWPSQAQFVAGQAVVLTSNCGSQATWMPLSAAPEPEWHVERAGERG